MFGASVTNITGTPSFNGMESINFPLLAKSRYIKEGVMMEVVEKEHLKKKRENFLGDFTTHSLRGRSAADFIIQVEGGVVVRDLFHPVLLEGYVTHCLIRNSLSLRAVVLLSISQIRRESAVATVLVLLRIAEKKKLFASSATMNIYSVSFLQKNKTIRHFFSLFCLYIMLLHHHEKFRRINEKRQQ